jgi:hypothetical protein
MLGATLASPYYYPPPPVVVQEQPPIEVQPEQQQAYYWYYCQNPQGYYPYVKSCPSGWIEADPDATPQGPPPITTRPNQCYAPRTDSNGQVIKDNDGNMAPDFSKPVPCPSTQ